MIYYMVIGKWFGDSPIIDFSRASEHELPAEELTSWYVEKMHELERERGTSQEKIEMMETRGEIVFPIAIYSSLSPITEIGGHHG